MNIIRKLKTAKEVLQQHGISEVAGLLSDNVEMFFIIVKRKLLGIWHRVADKVTAGLPRNPEKIRILYITTEFEAYHSQTVRYRIHNFREALKKSASTRFEIVSEVHSLPWADIVILMRTTWTDSVGDIIKSAANLKVPVVFDIDDIIFMPEYAPNYCTALGDSSDSNLIKRRSEFKGFEKTYKRCDFATASTFFIAEKMQKTGKSVFVIQNALNNKQLSIARKSHRKPQNFRAIGYLSGTNTHGRDFEQALPALEKIITEYPDVILRLAGYLDLSTLPEIVAKKTQTACYMSWGRLMKYSAQNYINIAPLDISNPFCNAKSELKYFESAVVGVPTVASATDTFSRCIENEKNGMLARTTEQWYNALKKLLDDKKFYESVAQEAKCQASEFYSPQATANQAIDAYHSIIDRYRGK